MNLARWGGDLAPIVEAALDAVVLTRPDGTIIRWNPVAERVFGWSADAVAGRRFAALVALTEAAQAGDPPSGREAIAQHRDGHAIAIDISVTRAVHLGQPVLLSFVRPTSRPPDIGEQQALVLGELDHRMRNLLTVVGSLARQASTGASSLDEFLPAFLGRLDSLARAHEALTSNRWTRASLRALVRDLLEPHRREQSDRIVFDGPDAQLAPRQYISLSMILHELATNAIKYGALSVPDGHVELSWAIDGGTSLLLDWTETSSLRIAPPSRQGFGSRMIAMSARKGLRGRSITSWRDDGVQFSLTFDLV